MLTAFPHPSRPRRIASDFRRRHRSRRASPHGYARKVLYPPDNPQIRSNSLKDLSVEHEVYHRIANLPHFPRMVEYDPEEGIVLQGMPDRTLRDRLKSEDAHRIISMAERLTWARDIAAALHALHTVHLIHGDVKPEIILLDESGKAYLIDFSGSCVDAEQGSAFESIRFMYATQLGRRLDRSDGHLYSWI